MQVHDHRSGKSETDRTKVALYFSQIPVTRAVRNVPVMPLGGPLGDLQNPANDSNYEVRTSMVLPMDITYQFVDPIPLPRLTRVEIVAHFDTEVSRADQAKLWLRFLRRMTDLEKNGGRLPSETP